MTCEPEPVHREVTINGCPAGVMELGAGSRAILLLHGGTPGMTPYAASAEIWRPLLPALAVREGVPRVIAIDLPGAGATHASAIADLTVAGRTRFVRAVAEELGIDELHLVAHAEADHVALAAARHPDRHIASVTLIAPTGAIPNGDRQQNLTLLHPPTPMWSARSQRWALERLSRNTGHVTDGLVTALTRNAEAEPHRTAAGRLADFLTAADIRADQTAAAGALYAYSRETGHTVPITIVVGADDPLSEVDRAAALLDILAGGGAPLDFQLIGDTGHFPFRERPVQTAQVIAAAVARTTHTS